MLENSVGVVSYDGKYFCNVCEISYCMHITFTKEKYAKSGLPSAVLDNVSSEKSPTYSKKCLSVKKVPFFPDEIMQNKLRSSILETIKQEAGKFICTEKEMFCSICCAELSEFSKKEVTLYHRDTIDECLGMFFFYINSHLECIII